MPYKTSDAELARIGKSYDAWVAQGNQGIDGFRRKYGVSWGVAKRGIDYWNQNKGKATATTNTTRGNWATYNADGKYSPETVTFTVNGMEVTCATDQLRTFLGALNVQNK